MKQGMDGIGAKRRTILWMGVVLAALVAIAAAPSDSVADEGEIQGSVYPSEFKFETTVPDDGTGEAGGWQVAKANVSISDARGSMFAGWSCKIQVEMPL